ncbi:unnamed protein product [Moneuplotes crassus]|uniref:Uncharacterized protein n=1 Tax=Euplotes crassus TaxID=5936 RepID=A0AAD1U882_EUPCR|nr:unnamed protein product [Moneuplotes crassus]
MDPQLVLSIMLIEKMYLSALRMKQAKILSRKSKEKALENNLRRRGLEDQNVKRRRSRNC